MQCFSAPADWVEVRSNISNPHSIPPCKQVLQALLHDMLYDKSATNRRACSVGSSWCVRLHMCLWLVCLCYICSVYDLYWSMLRLRMSEQGPSTRSKRARSILTHFSGPSSGATFTVAARGLSSNSAISPTHTDTHSGMFSMFGQTKPKKKRLHRPKNVAKQHDILLGYRIQKVIFQIR